MIDKIIYEVYGCDKSAAKRGTTTGTKGNAMKNRWVALTIIFVSFLQFTLNWFVIVPTFGPLIGTMHLALPQLGLIISAFIAGYGLTHIPGGLLAEAYGMRFALLLGIFVEAVGAIISGAAPGYSVLLIGRVIAGVGGSIYLGSAVGLTTAWFREHELVTATGIITGVAFTVGAVIGLFGWAPLVTDLGWRDALFAGAAVSLATFVMMLALFPTPPAARAEGVKGHHLNAAALRRVFGNANLWLLGISFVGTYGAYFTAAQLLPDYAEKSLGVGAAAGGALGVILLVAGIPGSFIGGWLSDRVFGVLPTFMGACLVTSLALVLVPFAGPGLLEILAGIIGGVGILGFVGWVSMPGLYRDRLEIADIPTAVGLMFTIAAIGGVGVPWLYGQIAGSYGYRTGWFCLGFLSVCFALVSLTVRRPGETVELARGRASTKNQVSAG
jgi:predicted MFS family arabinose efflux permease